MINVLERAPIIAQRGRRAIPRLIRFSVVGSSGVVMNMAAFSVLSTQLGLHYLAASAIAIELALCSNYLVNNNWTFADRRAGFFAVRGLLRYHAVSLGGMVVNLVMLQVLAGSVGLNPVLANLAGIAAATVWNLSLHLCWTWPRRRSVPPGLVALTE